MLMGFSDLGDSWWKMGEDCGDEKCELCCYGKFLGSNVRSRPVRIP